MMPMALAWRICQGSGSPSRPRVSAWSQTRSWKRCRSTESPVIWRVEVAANPSRGLPWSSRTPHRSRSACSLCRCWSRSNSATAAATRRSMVTGPIRSSRPASAVSTHRAAASGRPRVAVATRRAFQAGTARSCTPAHRRGRRCCRSNTSPSSAIAAWVEIPRAAAEWFGGERGHPGGALAAQGLRAGQVRDPVIAPGGVPAVGGRWVQHAPLGGQLQPAQLGPADLTLGHPRSPQHPLGVEVLDLERGTGLIHQQHETHTIRDHRHSSPETTAHIPHSETTTEESFELVRRFRLDEAARRSRASMTVGQTSIS